MTIKQSILISALCMVFTSHAQNFSGVYKIDGLLQRISHKDSTYVINFWTTWCKPCVQELPIFDSLSKVNKDPKLKIILVSLDFKEDLETKVKPFLTKHGIQAECILLNEENGNDFINKISNSWSGAIPATLFKTNESRIFIEKKMSLKELSKHLQDLSEKK